LLREKIIHFMAMCLFHGWAGCCNILSIPP